MANVQCNTIGERCELAGVTVDVWEKSLNGVENGIERVTLNKGTMIELYDWVNKNGFVLKDFVSGLSELMKDECVQGANVGAIQREVKKYMSERAKLMKSAKKDEGKKLNEYLGESVVLPGLCGSRVERVGLNIDRQLAGVIECQRGGIRERDFVIQEKEREIEVMRECLSEVSLDRMDLECKLKRSVESLAQSDNSLRESQVLNARNVNKRVRRMNEKLCVQENLIAEQREAMGDSLRMIEDSQMELCERERDLAEASEVVAGVLAVKEKYERARKSLWYYKRRECIMVEDVKQRVKGLNERVKELETENMQLQERVNEFVECDEVKCFVGGKYTCEIRRVYQELIGMGVSASKIEGIVRNVIEGMGKTVDRLPGETVARRMVFECRALAWMQLSETLERGENVTLQSDGTTKYGRHYGTFDVRMPEGSVYTLGLRDMAAGDSESTLELLKEVLGDVASMGAGDTSEKVSRMIAKIKNTMSDRAASEKKFNDVLFMYREDVLPGVVNGWEEMNEDERAKVVRMNNFFCGMHFVVGMAEQAEATLKLWEGLVFGEQDVGANAVLASKSWKSESGTVRLIRTVCKSVQDRGCEKSGKPVQFREFMRVHHGVQSIPLAPFKGNRFNIAFHNGAGVYALYPQLCEFMSQVKDENMLMKAVNADLQVKQYVAGVRALGLIDKLVTVPLWKVTERKEHVQSMTARYDSMLQKFVRWSEDASAVLQGVECVFEDVDVHKDWVYDALVKVSELDGMTKQVLELMFAGFVKKTRMLLSDQLSGGENAGMNAERMNETVSVPKTNVSPERDFGMLDNLMRARPSAYTCAMEGVIMYRRNRTGKWMDGMTDERLHSVIEQARKSVERQRLDYLRRKAVIGAKRAGCMKVKRDARERKELKERVRAEELSAEMGVYGGLWLNEEQIDERLSEIERMEEKKKAVESQLKFRKYVLKARNVNGCLNLSSGGVRFEYERMVENLKVVVLSAGEERELAALEEVPDVRCAPVNVVNEEKERYMHVEDKENECVAGHARKRKRVTASDKVPKVRSMHDLIGKRVEYLSDRGVWMRGTVVDGRLVDDGKSKRFMHAVRFDGCLDVTEVDWRDDFRNGAVRVVALTVAELVGSEVEHLCKDEETGAEAWWKASVVACLNATKLNPEFTVRYDRVDDGNEEEEDEDESEVYYGFPLFEDYASGDLRLL